MTIAKSIDSEDPIEKAVIDIIKYGSLRTNNEAGDGTTTTTLITSVMLTEGMKLIEDGHKGITLKKDLEKVAETIMSNLKPHRIKSSKDLLNVARISANNDDDIAKHVVDVVKTADQDGIVLIEMSHKESTEVVKDTGFIIEGGLISPEYAQNQSMSATFDDCHVFVTDKRLYYQEEAEAILMAAMQAGIKKLVIVARDFIGKSVNVFSANQLKNEEIDLILVKDPNAKDNDNNSLQDLAIYLGGELVTERHGKLVNNVKDSYFVHADKVYANPYRTVISSTHASEELTTRIKNLKKEKDDNPEDKEVGRRLAALTTGIVTVKVGGSTQIETQEKIFRYEDAINATRSAMKHGYLPGGGLALLGAYVAEQYPEQYRRLAKQVCEASVRQIAKNCGQHEDYVVDNCKPYVNFGYNAKTGAFEDLVVAGVIDPFKVTELAVKNAASIAGAILSANWFIVQEKVKSNKE